MPTIPYRSGFYGLATPGRVAEPLNAFQEEERAKALDRGARGEVSEFEKNSLHNDVAASARAAQNGGGRNITLDPARCPEKT